MTKYLSKVDEVLRQSMLYRAGGDQDNLFLMLLRATNLITETIPKHKDFRPDAPGYLKFHRLLGAMVTELEQLKRTLDARDVAMARARKAAADAARPSVAATACTTIKIACVSGAPPRFAHSSPAADPSAAKHRHIAQISQRA